METYIDNALNVLNWQELKCRRRPISGPIDTDSGDLTPAEVTKFHSALGMISWLATTARPDVSYAHSRIGQHQASPNKSAYNCVKEVFGYLKATKTLC
jgi:hypothetical protein